MPRLSVNRQRVLQRLRAFSHITDKAQPYSRVAFSSEYAAGREYLKREMHGARLESHIDDGGNLIGRLRGKASVDAMAVGSHTDTVFGGGRFDGVLGVVAALEVVQCIEEASLALPCDLLVIDFLAEEVGQWGLSCIGSRAMTGTLPAEALRRTDSSGRSLHEALELAGGHPEALESGVPLRRDLKAYLELHIEQGPVLEAGGQHIGVVTSVVGINRYELVVWGRASHAGTTPMHMRHDALVAASSIVATVHDLTLERARASEIVATIGRQEVWPNQGNVVPERVTLLLEVRSEDARAAEQLVADIGRAVSASDSRYGTRTEWRSVSATAAVHFDQQICDSFDAHARRHGLMTLRIPSGAGHDAAVMSAITRAGMIFVPSRKGISHHKDEYTSDEHAISGTQVLLDAVLEVAHG